MDLCNIWDGPIPFAWAIISFVVAVGLPLLALGFVDLTQRAFDGWAVDSWESSCSIVFGLASRSTVGPTLNIRQRASHLIAQQSS